MGKTVKVVCPTDTDFDDQLPKLGVELIPLKLSRKGINPIWDLQTFFQLIKIFRREKPEIVLNYTIKPVIYSSLAAKVTSAPKVCSFITGLGHVFTSHDSKTKVIRKIVTLLYRVALSSNFKVFFQNYDDLNQFLVLKLVSPEKCSIINGSGVNFKKFYTQSADKLLNSFVLVARLLKDKGIGEFVQAAKIIKKKHPDTTFWLCGSPDDNPASYSVQDVKDWVDEGILNHITHTNDVRSFIEDKEVFVLPSYREGTPRSVLEAMAMKMPIITTDAPGCRETTTHGKNGYLVEVKSVDPLVSAMEQFIINPKLKAIMGEESYKIALQKYDVNKVNEKIIKDLGI